MVETACPCPQMGGVSRSAPGREGTPLSLSPSQAGPCQDPVLGLGGGTHAPCPGWGEWGPASRKGPKGGFREPGDSGRGVSGDPVTGRGGAPGRGKREGGSTGGRDQSWCGGVTFEDDLPPGSLQRLDGLVVGGIPEIDAVNGEDGVAQTERPAPLRRQPREDT